MFWQYRNSVWCFRRNKKVFDWFVFTNSFIVMWIPRKKKFRPKKLLCPAEREKNVATFQCQNFIEFQFHSNWPKVAFLFILSFRLDGIFYCMVIRWCEESNVFSILYYAILYVLCTRRMKKKKKENDNRARV